MTVLIIDSDEPGTVAAALESIAEDMRLYGNDNCMSCGAGTHWDYEMGFRLQKDSCALASILHCDADGVIIGPPED